MTQARTAALTLATPRIVDGAAVVSDHVQAGTMAVMAIADTAQFDLALQRGRRY